MTGGIGRFVKKSCKMPLSVCVVRKKAYTALDLISVLFPSVYPIWISTVEHPALNTKKHVGILWLYDLKLGVGDEKAEYYTLVLLGRKGTGRISKLAVGGEHHGC